MRVDQSLHLKLYARDFDPELIQPPESLGATLLRVVASNNATIRGLVGVIVTADQYVDAYRQLESAYPKRVWTGAGRRRQRDIALVTPTGKGLGMTQ